MKSWSLAGLVLVAATAGGIGFLLRGGGTHNGAEPASAAKGEPKPANQLRFPEGAPQLAALRIEAVGEAPLPIAEALNGKISYDEDVTARISSPVAGRIVGLRAAAGDHVKSGDVLVTIDAPDLAAAIADTRKGAADEARKKLAMERAAKLYEGEVVPRKDFEAAAADYEQAQAESQRAGLRLKNLAPAGSGSGLSLRSPISGVVAERKANPAMEVQPGNPDALFVVSDLRRLWVLIDLPEQYLSRIKPGLPVSVSVAAYPGETFRASVTRIGLVVNPDTRRIQVRCDLANVELLLKPEMYARVYLLASEGQQAIRITNDALVTDGLYSYVFVEKQPRVFEKRKIELAVQDREYAYLRGGLTKGERVVTGGALLLQSELTSGS